MTTTQTENNNNDRVTIYTDGACSGNPGPGGWGVLMLWNGHEKELNGGEPETTNNRMEMMAVCEGLESLNRRCQVVVEIDSQYVKNGITTWIHAWKKRGWKTAAKKPVKNQDLWMRLDKAVSEHDIEWRWVKGHADHDDNNRCDELARDAATRQRA